MKRLFFTIMLALAAAVAAQAQPDPDERGEKVQAMRVAFYTRLLDLSPEEAQNFWPVFNDFLEQRENLQRQLKAGQNPDNLSDGELEDYVRRHFELKQRELDLERETYQKLRKVLPMRKVAKLPLAERRFRERIVEIIKENRQEQRRRPRGGG